MAEAGNEGQAGTAGAPPNLSVLAQYVKDFSFESPGAPGSLGPQPTQPNINVSIGVQSRQLGPDQIEVELRIDARATVGQQVLFAAELVYAGIFRFTNIPAENMQPVVLIECPRLLFPFARQIISDATRNGGFPPLMIDPVDFVAMYRQQLEAASAQQPANLS